MSDWCLAYEGYDPRTEGLREALCTLGNGYFATRGAAPESVADGIHYPGTYVAGCYDRLTSRVAGRDVENEDLVNLPNWLALGFRLGDGPWFSLDAVELLSHRLELDLRRGILLRSLRFRDPEGRETAVAQRRFVHMRDPHLAGIETTFLTENWSVPIKVCSALDGRVTNSGVARYRGLEGAHLVPVDEGATGEDAVWLRVETVSSGIRVAQAARTRVLSGDRPVTVRRELRRSPGYVAHDLAFDLCRGQAVTVEKIVALHTSKDHAIAECGQAARQAVARAAGFDELSEAHVLAWDHLWRGCGLWLEGEAGAALNLHVFHLLQTLSPHVVDLDVGVPARGLHGEAYRGHVFWDEVFVLPFLNYRFPEISRAVLRYRWRRLPEARHAARAAGMRGAMFPWQSGSDGREETQTLHLNPRSGRWLPDHSRLQRHVGAAVAYNVWQYHQATGDLDFLCAEGGELLIEIARFWSSAATYDKAHDRYRITGVVGPDEYHDAYPGAPEPGIADNTYTNVMAVWVLRRALDLTRLLPAHRQVELFERLALRREEIDRWEDLAHKMRVCFHGDGVISQFEGYESLEEFDWTGYRAKYGDIRRLDRILEAEGDTTNRYKASKQPDVLMLFYLFSADELREIFTDLGYPLDAETIPRTIDYYLQRTSHGSTLSGVVHAWVLARANRPDSWQFFTEALASDLHDVQGGTTAEGIHLGAMAGTVDLVQRCFTGLETRHGVLRLSPSVPAELGKFAFSIRYRGHWEISLSFTREHVRVSLPPSETAPIRIGVKGRITTIEPGQSVELP